MRFFRTLPTTTGVAWAGLRFTPTWRRVGASVGVAFMEIFILRGARAGARRKRVGLLVHSLIFHDPTSFVLGGCLRAPPTDSRLKETADGIMKGLWKTLHLRCLRFSRYWIHFRLSGRRRESCSSSKAANTELFFSGNESTGRNILLSYFDLFFLKAICVF